MTGKFVTVVTFLLGFFLADMPAEIHAQAKSKIKSEDYKSHPSKQSAVHHVKRETGGRVLDVKQRSSGSGKVWRVKFLKDGKIQYMDVLPQTATD